MRVLTGPTGQQASDNYYNQFFANVHGVGPDTPPVRPPANVQRPPISMLPYDDGGRWDVGSPGVSDSGIRATRPQGPTVDAGIRATRPQGIAAPPAQQSSFGFPGFSGFSGFMNLVPLLLQYAQGQGNPWGGRSL